MIVIKYITIWLTIQISSQILLNVSGLLKLITNNQHYNADNKILIICKLLIVNKIAVIA